MIVLHQDFPCIEKKCNCGCHWPKNKGMCPPHAGICCEEGFTYQKLTQNVEEARDKLEVLESPPKERLYDFTDFDEEKLYEEAVEEQNQAQARLAEIEEEKH